MNQFISFWIHKYIGEKEVEEEEDDDDADEEDIFSYFRFDAIDDVCVMRPEHLINALFKHHS